ncbi:MAG: dockerin type I repeat-containing protein, partial [Oscillospiraceae bacterium]
IKIANGYAYNCYVNDVEYELLVNDGTATSSDTDTDIPANDESGDIDGSGVIDILDVVVARSYIVGNGWISTVQITIGDVNNDGKLDILDIVILRSLIVNS